MPRKPLNRLIADAKRAQADLAAILANPTSFNFRYLSQALAEIQALADAVNAEFPGSIDVSKLLTLGILENLEYAIKATNDAIDILELASSSSSQSESSSSSSGV